ncbi:unnamed protein product [Peronospora destructor]|uniref:Uncharacterized protein n=1 Tax=Peronospora destructor TaxID=86335 RepID=A0AAV0U698_9STRA|nr:unnamed protein product [Peronospora destructor]
MESPPASLDTRHLSSVSYPGPDSPLESLSDSFTESQQCSADPNAFLGFYVPSTTTKNTDTTLQQKLMVFELLETLQVTIHSMPYLLEVLKTME